MEVPSATKLRLYMFVTSGVNPVDAYSRPKGGFEPTTRTPAIFSSSLETAPSSVLRLCSIGC